MNKRSIKYPAQPTRRRAIAAGGALTAAAIGAPWVARFAHAQAADLGPYQNSKINWRQAEGAEITVCRNTRELFRQPDRARTTVRSTDWCAGSLRESRLPDRSGKKQCSICRRRRRRMQLRPPIRCTTRCMLRTNGSIRSIATLNDAKLTDDAWFRYDDIFKAWRDADSIDGKPYGIPYDGEVTVQVFRKDLYDAKGLKAADTLDEFVKNAAAIHDPANRMYGMALRGFAGAGQNMYIYPSLFKEFGGEWIKGNRIVVNSPEAVRALDWYVDVESKYAPPAVRNWNWPDIADAFSQGTLGAYIDAHSSAAVLMNPEKSKVIGKMAFARWPQGPTGKRCTSIWNWGFPINAALDEKQKRATWLFIQWAAAAETQARTSWKFAGPAKRSGLNRTSLWRSPEFVAMTKDIGPNFVDAALTSLEQDTDVNWRPRIPQWPAVGDTMATAIQSALVGQKKSKEALDEAQARIDQILKS